MDLWFLHHHYHQKSFYQCTNEQKPYRKNQLFWNKFLYYPFFSVHCTVLQCPSSTAIHYIFISMSLIRSPSYLFVSLSHYSMMIFSICPFLSSSNMSCPPVHDYLNEFYLSVSVMFLTLIIPVSAGMFSYSRLETRDSFYCLLNIS